MGRFPVPRMQKLVLLSVTIFSIAFLRLTNAVDEAAARELPCFQVNSTVDPEPNWVKMQFNKITFFKFLNIILLINNFFSSLIP